MEQTTGQVNQAYGKRPLWQWILLYVVIAAIVYGLVYYFLLAKKPSYNNSQSEQHPTKQPTSQPSTTASGMPSATMKITVEGSEFAFNPSTITVKKGQQVTLILKNTGQFPHNLAIPALNVQTKTIQPGEQDTITFTPTNSGSFPYICTVPGHAERGMKGTLLVQ